MAIKLLVGLNVVIQGKTCRINTLARISATFELPVKSVERGFAVRSSFCMVGPSLLIKSTSVSGSPQ